MTVVMETYREGIAVGEKRGEKRGENRAILYIISLMQQNGLSMEDICKNTGLSEEEVIQFMSAKKE